MANEHLWVWDPASLARAKESYRLVNHVTIGKGDQDITDRKDWVNLLKSPPEVTQVFILVELNWLGSHLDGLTACRNLMNAWEHESAPQVVLFSFRSREQLWAQCSAADRAILKSFPFVQLPSMQLPATMVMSKAKWRYLRKYALTKSGILDDLIHRLRNAIRAGVAGREAMSRVAVELQDIPDLQDDTIRALLSGKESAVESGDAQRWAGELLSAMDQRLFLLDPETLNKALRTRSSRKPKLLLVEDAEGTRTELAERLSQFFEVHDHSSGADALRELQEAGASYNALICDLELLETNEKFDQVVQGIDILDYAARECKHIPRRVITNLGRRGVLELLPDMKMEDILFKTLIGKNVDGLFLEFVGNLLNAVEKQRVLLHMYGPNSTVWSDVSLQKDQKDARGGGMRGFYYELMRDRRTDFDAMWSRIADKIKLVVEKHEVKVSCSFAGTRKAKKQLDSPDTGFKIEFLEKLLTHRMVLLTLYDDGELVPYRNDGDPDNSYRHLPIWEGKPKPAPGAYLYYLGMSAVDVKPITKPTEKHTVVRFTLKHGPLFKEETELFAKLPKAVRERKLTSFFEEHRNFCFKLNECLHAIHDHLSQKDRSNFAFAADYPPMKNNAGEINKEFASTVLKKLAAEPRKRQNEAREPVTKVLERFRDGELDEGTTIEFQALPNDIGGLVDQWITAHYS